MKKKLLAALIVVSLLLAVAIGAVIYMERNPGEENPEQTVPTTVLTTEPATATDAPTEETVGISLPTENPEDRAPQYEFSDEDETLPEQTADPEATFDPDENETPRETF